MPNKPLPPWQRHPDYRNPHGQKKELPNVVPVPGGALGHPLPYKADDWYDIEKLQGTQRGLAVVRMRCHGVKGTSKTSQGEPCQATDQFVARLKVFDRFVKWLCYDCLYVRGFAWGSTINQEEYVLYQLVRKYEDDTLLRRLDQSPNYKEEFHTPIAKIPDPLGGKP